MFVCVPGWFSCGWGEEVAVIGFAVAKILPLVALMASTGHGGTLARSENFDPTQLLAGLKGVSVMLEDENYQGGKISDPENPLIKSEFQTLVELKLRQSGIQVVGVDDHRVDIDYPYLYLRVDNLVHNRVRFFTINLGLLQWGQSPTAICKLPGGKRVPAPGYFEAWKRPGLIGIVGQEVAVETLKGGVGGLVDQFCNDWLKANPKK